MKLRSTFSLFYRKRKRKNKKQNNLLKPVFKFVDNEISSKQPTNPEHISGFANYSHLLCGEKLRMSLSRDKKKIFDKSTFHCCSSKNGLHEKRLAFPPSHHSAKNIKRMGPVADLGNIFMYYIYCSLYFSNILYRSVLLKNTDQFGEKFHAKM